MYTYLLKLSLTFYDQTGKKKVKPMIKFVLSEEAHVALSWLYFLKYFFLLVLDKSCASVKNTDRHDVVSNHTFCFACPLFPIYHGNIELRNTFCVCSALPLVFSFTSFFFPFLPLWCAPN